MDHNTTMPPFLSLADFDVCCGGSLAPFRCERRCGCAAVNSAGAVLLLAKILSNCSTTSFVNNLVNFCCFLAAPTVLVSPCRWLLGASLPTLTARSTAVGAALFALVGLLFGPPLESLAERLEKVVT